MRLFGTVTSNIASALLGAVLFGGAGFAFAANSGPSSVPVIAAPAPQFANVGISPAAGGGGVYTNPLLGSACDTAPAVSYKYGVFQDVDYSFNGSNDRIHIGWKSQGWSNDQVGYVYEDLIRLEARGHSSTRITEVWVCMATTQSVYTDDLDPWGNPMVETTLVEAHWQRLYSNRSGQKVLDLARPASSWQLDTNGWTSSFMAAMFVGGKGSGKTVPNILGGPCCMGGGM